MKNKLTENQVSALLKKGYSYTDISLYEQVTNKPGENRVKDLTTLVTGPTGPPKPFDPPTGPMGPAGPPPVNPTIPTDGPQVPGGITPGPIVPPGPPPGPPPKPNWNPDKTPSGPLGGPTPPPKPSLDVLSNIPGMGPIGGVTPKVPGGIAPFGSFSDMAGEKIRQIQGEGYDKKFAKGLFEKWANHAFGQGFLNENSGKLDAVTFDLEEMKKIKENWNTYLKREGIARNEGKASDAFKAAMKKEQKVSRRKQIKQPAGTISTGGSNTLKMEQSTAEKKFSVNTSADFNPTYSDSLKVQDFRAGNIKPYVKDINQKTVKNDDYDKFSNMSDQFGEIDFSPEAIADMQGKIATADVGPTFTPSQEEIDSGFAEFRPTDSPESSPGSFQEPGNWTTMLDPYHNPTDTPIPADFDFSGGNQFTGFDDSGAWVGRQDLYNENTKSALSKNEEMSPEKNHTALRDWTSKMKESLMQEKDYDGDGKVETGQEEWKGSRNKAIKKNMQEKQVFYTDDKDRVRKFDDGR